MRGECVGGECVEVCAMGLMRGGRSMCVAG